MKSAKTASQRQYASLQDLTVDNLARQVSAQRFDFGRDSAVAQHLVQRTLSVLQDEESAHGIRRVPPFTMRLGYKHRSLEVSLLDAELAGRLAAGVPFGQLLRSRREAVFKELLAIDPAASMDEVRRLLAPSELLAAGGRLPRSDGAPAIADINACRADLARLRTTLAVPDTLLPAPEQLVPPPESVVGRLSPSIESEGRSPEMARSFISHLLALRERFCPRLDELESGQLVAIALDVTDRRMSLKTRYRRQVPVRLTLLREDEVAQLERVGPWDRSAVDGVLSRRVARLLTEAYCQGGLLSLTLVGLLTHNSPSRVSRLVNEFEARHGLILPTPGTIHDAGSKLTHKAAIVRLHLQGLECKDIARDTMHCEEAVGRYIDDFERVLIAQAHGLPAALLPRVLKLGAHVVAQYDELIRELIGGSQDVQALLVQRGIDVEEQAA